MDNSIVKKIKNSLSKNANIAVLVVTLLVIGIALSLVTGGVFSSYRNLSNLFRQMSVVTIVASGVFLIILTGNIDLSVGSLLGMLGGFAAVAMTKWGWGTIPTILATIAIGALVGCLHGFLVAFVKVPAFIVTLGGYMAYRGLLVQITGGATISNLKPDYAQIGQAYISGLVGWILSAAILCIFVFLTLQKRKMRSKYNLDNPSIFFEIVKVVVLGIIILLFIFVMNAFEGLPIPVLIMLVMVALITVIAERTKFGRDIYAIGGNSEAAKYSGINVRKVTFLSFVLNGAIVAIAATVYTARLNAATTQAGYMLELDAIAAVVIGGTSLAGGIGRASTVILGSLLMAVIDNGMSVLNVQSEWQLVVKGVVLVLAVTMDVLTNRKRR